MAEANSINAATTGIVGNTGTAFTGTAVTQHAIQVGGSTTSTLTSIAIGSTGQFFQANSAADPTWSTATLPSTATGTGKVLIADGTNWVASTPTFPNASATSGKIIISDGTNWIASTPTYPNTSGTAGKVVVSDGTNNVYSTPTFPNASATSRKIIVSDGTNWVASTETWAVPGTSGNVLTSNGTNWTSAASSSGKLVFIQSQTATSSTTLNFTTGITSTYNNYMLEVSNVLTATASKDIYLRISTDGGSTYIATGYQSGINVAIYTSGTYGNINITSGFFLLYNLNSSGVPANGTYWLYNMTSGTGYPACTGRANENNNGTGWSDVSMTAFYNTASTTVNAFQILTSSTSILQGKFTLYGILES